VSFRVEACSVSKNIMEYALVNPHITSGKVALIISERNQNQRERNQN